MITPEMKAKAPAPLYGCATQGCAEQKSVSATELRWRKDGYYCETCIDGMAADDGDLHAHGATLAAWQQARIGGALGDAMPEPYYPCAREGGCAIEQTYPVEMLAWWRDGFYCQDCVDELVPCPDDTEESEAEYEARHDGPSLAEVLR